jgi:formylglycine-generating enzyme required for sulfatase activity
MSGPDDRMRGPAPYSHPSQHDPAAVSTQKQNELARRLRHRPLPMAPRATALARMREEARRDDEDIFETSTAPPPGKPSRGERSRRTGVTGILVISAILGSASFAFTMNSLTGGEWWSALLKQLEGPDASSTTVSASVAYLEPVEQNDSSSSNKNREGRKVPEIIDLGGASEHTGPQKPDQLAPPPEEASPAENPAQPGIPLLPAARKEKTSAAIKVKPPLPRPKPSVIARPTEEAAGTKDAAESEDRNPGEVVVATEMLPEETASAEASSPSQVTVASAAPQELEKPPNGPSFKDCSLCPEMVAIPAGQFMMGTSAADGAPANNDESPQHGVTIARPFALGRFEITLDDWKACVSDGGCSTKPSDKGDERRPVTKISWDDVERQYLPWLSRKTGHTYRLPTEAEWEYAARGGASAPAGQKFGFGNDESRICEYGNSADLSAREARGGWIESSCKDGFAEMAPVGSLKPNSLNLYDMHGNVWEWVQDCWNGNYQSAPSDGSAWTKGDCSLRVIRGGSWAAEVTGLRSADRGWNRPNAGSTTIGFRVARSL